MNFLCVLESNHCHIRYLFDFSFSKECIKFEISSIRQNQKSEYVHINTTFQNETTLDVEADLLQSFVNPACNIEITKWSRGRSLTNIFNTTIRFCEMERLSSRDLFVKAIREFFLKLTNFTLTCPLASGRYSAKVRTKFARTLFPLRLFYEKDSFISLHFRFYEQIPRGNYTYLAEYLTNGLIKRYC